MKTIRLLILLTAFLIMISSVLSLQASGADRTPVYINVAAMGCLVAVVTLLNFKKDTDKR